MPAPLFACTSLGIRRPAWNPQFFDLDFRQICDAILDRFLTPLGPHFGPCWLIFPLFLLLFSGIDFELIFQRFRCHFPTPESRKITFLLQTCRKIQGFAGTKKNSVFHRCLCNFRTRFSPNSSVTAGVLAC